MIAAQGGDARVVEDPSRLLLAPAVVPVLAPEGGFVTGVDALEIGLAGVAMGAGRTRADQQVDPAVAIELCKARGDRVEKGAELAKIYVREPKDAEAVHGRIAKAFTLGAEQRPVPALVLGRIE
jgi:pyrimidine-nucleoside phosphorylase